MFQVQHSPEDRGGLRPQSYGVRKDRKGRGSGTLREGGGEEGSYREDVIFREGGESRRTSEAREEEWHVEDPGGQGKSWAEGRRNKPCPLHCTSQSAPVNKSSFSPLHLQLQPAPCPPSPPCPGLGKATGDTSVS